MEIIEIQANCKASSDNDRMYKIADSIEVFKDREDVYGFILISISLFYLCMVVYPQNL